MAHPPPPIVRATVVADGLSTNFLAAGSGPPVLLLVAEQRRLPILAALGGYFRVVAPEIPSPAGGPSDFLTADGGVHPTTPSPAARWIDGLLDGIGIEAVVMVADDTLSEFARSYTDSAPGRVSHLLVLDSGQDIAAALQHLKARHTDRGAMPAIDLTGTATSLAP